MKILLDAWAFISIITFHRDNGGHLLEATSARKHHVAAIFPNGHHLDKKLVLPSPWKPIDMVKAFFSRWRKELSFQA